MLIVRRYVMLSVTRELASHKQIGCLRGERTCADRLLALERLQ